MHFPPESLLQIIDLAQPQRSAEVLAFPTVLPKLADMDEKASSTSSFRTIVVFVQYFSILNFDHGDPLTCISFAEFERC
ncbi:hypothetical protein [Sphingomonas spermidinifaciens]|uniref:hypothetical protein n=1 Tax=Sphingomonas spermidinifaciens TaxID=1141889 RepID=UPI001143D3B2|nr:hypothetical protein [Sphingomonas spermidinifaciens]